LTGEPTGTLITTIITNNQRLYNISMKKAAGILIALFMIVSGCFLIFLVCFSFVTVPPDADTPPFFLEIEKVLPGLMVSEESTEGTSSVESDFIAGEKPVFIFVLRIPDISIETRVYEGTSKRVLMSGPGHLRGSAMPGERGNCVISGHRVTFGGPFYRLHKLKPGNRIIVEFKKKRYIYEVKWIKRVKPEEIWVAKFTSTPSITLTTCDPPFSGRYRLVVRGELMDVR